MTSKARDTADIVDDVSVELASKLDEAGGKILQIVRATDSTNRSTTSTSFVDASLSVTITPQKSDSAIIVIATGYALANRTSGTGNRAKYQITDASNNALSGAEAHTIGTFRYSYGTSALDDHALTIVGYSTPATTSATTYKLRFAAGESGNNADLQNAAVTAQMYAIEVSA